MKFRIRYIPKIILITFFSLITYIYSCQLTFYKSNCKALSFADDMLKLTIIQCI